MLDALKRQSYDVVLMDVQMPEMDGLEATKQIRREYGAGQQPRIIAITAHALKGDKERYLSDGMDAYISKPVRVEELIHALRESRPLHDRSTGPLVRADADGARSGHHADDGSPIDMIALEELRAKMGADAPELMADLIQTFLQDTPKLLTDMQQALKIGDLDGLYRAAHSLKASSATFGAGAITDQCETLEELGSAGVMDGAAEALACLENQYEDVKVVLESIQHG